jgi:hypothetical protein
MAGCVPLLDSNPTMLRITLHDSGEAFTLQVEGRLIGAWATELEQTWKNAVPIGANRARIIDLTGILFIDGEGKRVLTKLFREGASFRTAGPLTESIVSEITLKPNPQVQLANLRGSATK